LLQLGSTGETLELFVRGISWGSPVAKTKIFCVHGWLDNSGSFAPLAEFLCKNADVQVVAFDLLGHGLSDRLPLQDTEGEREGEKEREREREEEREIEREKERERERRREKERDRERKREKEREFERKGAKEKERERKREKKREKERKRERGDR